MAFERITNKVRSTIAGRLNSAVSGAIRSGVGSLTGVTKEGATSAINPITKHEKLGTTILQYPSDVGGSSRQGHYIVFSINEFLPGKLKHIVTKKNFEQAVANVKSFTSGDDDITEQEMKQMLESEIQDVSRIEQARSSSKKGKSILAEKPTRRTGAYISLYMPPSLSVSYNVTYADQEIGTLAGMGMAAIEAFKNAEGGSTTAKFSAAASAIKPGAKEGLTNFINTTLDTLAPGARALQQINSGKVITPRMEMMFEGVGRRSFSYKFDFIPKSAQEAKSIERIIYAFKENMMPEYTGTSRREMKIPNTFDISYMYENTQNKFINKISSCFLKDMDVQYGADRFTAYDPIDGSPPPQRSSISLSFTEIETLSKDLIKEGF
jgi:hypothetical protein